MTGSSPATIRSTRRLAAARRADEHEELTVLEGEVDPGDGSRAVGVDFAEIVQFERRHAIPVTPTFALRRRGRTRGLGANMVTWASPTTDDPLLQPYQLKHLTIRNRVFSSSHEPAYSVNGMPGDRYRLYHVEKAKGGIGMTMTAGSAVVAEDSPPAFGNLHAYKDEIVPCIRRMTDEVHEHGAACMIQITHLGRRTGWAQDDWLPIVSASPVREPAHRNIPSRPRTGTSSASSASTPTPPSACRRAGWTASSSRPTGTCSTSSCRR